MLFIKKKKRLKVLPALSWTDSLWGLLHLKTPFPWHFSVMTVSEIMFLKYLPSRSDLVLLPPYWPSVQGL